MESDTAQKLSSIFSSAGQAFAHMAELTMQLKSTGDGPSLNGKWTDNEVDMLKGAVERFGSDLGKIGSVIKNRTQDEIKKQSNTPVAGDKSSPVKGNENVPSRQSAESAEKKPRLAPPPVPIPNTNGPPVIRTLSNTTVAPVTATSQPLVLNPKPAGIAPPMKEQKARRGGPKPLRSGPGPASRTRPQPVPVQAASTFPPGGPTLVSMLESGKRQANTAGLSDYQKMKLMREAEDPDYSGSESDEDDSDDTDESSEDED